MPHLPGIFHDDSDSEGGGGRANEIAPNIFQTDVRTPIMQQLEQASLPLLLQTLLNPAGTPQRLGAQPLAQGAGGGLLAMLLGGGGGQQTAAPAGGGGNQQSPLNFLQLGGQLEENAINIVGESGPEAVVGDQVTPLDGGTGGGDGTLAPNLQSAVQTILGGSPGGAQQQTQPAPQSGGGSAGGGQDIPLGNDIGLGPIFGVGPGGQQVGGGQLPNAGQFPTSAQQGPGTGVIASLLGNNPEQQAFGAAQQFLTGEGGLLGQAPGAGVIGAAQPVFEQNLQSSLQGLRDVAPNVFGTGIATAGTDLSRQALQDFNLMAAQAAQQGVGQQLQGLGTLGQLAQPAGQNPFQRALGAGQFGLATQNQAFQQQIGPTLQLLTAALGQASPTAFQTIATGEGGK